MGLTEQQARDQGLTVRVGLADIARSARGWLHGPGTTGLVKVVEDADRGVLVGATVVAPYGGEVIGLLVTAVHAEVPVARLRTMHYAYPTFHRAIEAALNRLGRGDRRRARASGCEPEQTSAPGGCDRVRMRGTGGRRPDPAGREEEPMSQSRTTCRTTPATGSTRPRSWTRSPPRRPRAVAHDWSRPAPPQPARHRRGDATAPTR